MTNRELIELDVAILGGGFAGVYCAKALRKLTRRPGIHVALIAEQNYMVFQPMLPEVVGGGLSPRHVINPIRHLCKGVDVFKARIESLDTSSRTLQMSMGNYSHSVPVKFKHVVFALGAEIDLSRVPGMPEHAYLMQNVGDAMRLHSVVVERCEEANLVSSRQGKRRLLTFVIVGGGYSGVETAGQILDMLHGVQRLYKNIDKSDYRVILVHSGDTVLPSLSPKLGKYAERKLRKAGMQFNLGHRVKAVTANQVYLDDGQTIDTNTVVCTVGNAPHRLLRQMCEQHDVCNERGRLRTDEALRVEGQKDMWAIGDCASVPMEKGGFCPATAQFALRQGKLCGENIIRDYDGRPPEKFNFSGLGEMASIGRQKAVANVGGVNISGFPAWWLWRTVYLMKLPGLERKLRVMLDWTLDLFFSKDFNLLNPDQTRVVNNIHLEKGDRLFNAGDPPFSLYFVIRGRIDLKDKNRVAMSIGPGEFFGERALTKNLPYIYDAIAVEPTELTSLDGGVFMSLVNNSVVLKRIFTRTATQYKTVEEMRTLQARLDPKIALSTAAELMQSDLVTLGRDMTLAEAIPTIKARRHSSYPVVDDDGTLFGLISREDFFCVLKSSSTPLETRISQLELRQLPVATADTPAPRLIELMLTQGSSKVLINDRDAHLVGIVTMLDLLCETAASSEPSAVPPAPDGNSPLRVIG